MTKKNKKSIIVLVSFLAVLLLISFYVVAILISPINKTEFAQRINYCHNRGVIQVTVEGKLVNLEEMKIRRINKAENIDEKTGFNEGSFIFLSGKQGKDVFELELSKEDTELENDITIVFEKFNENWWNVNVFNIEVDIHKEKDGLYAKTKAIINEKTEIKNDNKFDKNKKARLFFVGEK